MPWHTKTKTKGYYIMYKCEETFVSQCELRLSC